MLSSLTLFENWSLISVWFQIFGAYCSNKWLDRNHKDERGNRTTYFGTGETFLFSLQPERRKYPWVGIENDSKNHSNELFMAADPQMITIGGGYAPQFIYFNFLFNFRDFFFLLSSDKEMFQKSVRKTKASYNSAVIYFQRWPSHMDGRKYTFWQNR